MVHSNNNNVLLFYKTRNKQYFEVHKKISVHGRKHQTGASKLTLTLSARKRQYQSPFHNFIKSSSDMPPLSLSMEHRERMYCFSFSTPLWRAFTSDPARSLPNFNSGQSRSKVSSMLGSASCFFDLLRPASMSDRRALPSTVLIRGWG